ncbi:MAG TPA: hypothetical protein VIG33_07675 [Pseudobdellovibrionaceae bacterium]|jgi:hypothetical protein
MSLPHSESHEYQNALVSARTDSRKLFRTLEAITQALPNRDVSDKADPFKILHRGLLKAIDELYLEIEEMKGETWPS